MNSPLRGGIFALAFAAFFALDAFETANAQNEQCMNMDCFYDGQIRDYRALDEDTVIIYIGADRCPFLVELQGTFCDAKFLPDIDFFQERERRMSDRTARARAGGRDPAMRDRMLGRGGGASGINSADQGGFGITRNDRVCLNMASQYALETFGFGKYFEDDVPQDIAECPVISVTRLTDDDLLEFYADGGVPPPPPIGNGSITRGENADETQQ